MLLYLFLLRMCQLDFSEGSNVHSNPNATNKNKNAPVSATNNNNKYNNNNNQLTGTNNKWYGPSYSPGWWNPDDSLAVRGPEFSYEGPNSAATWPQRFSECGGKMQSPINIQTTTLERRRTKRPLTWNNYSNLPKTMVLENSKYSLHGNCIWDKISQIPYITNGPLEHRYYFSQFHFHWGSDSSRGSEHTVDGKRYPLEMHVVHDRQDEETGSQSDNSTQLVVVAFMFEKGNRDNPYLKPILDRVKDVAGSAKKKTFVTPLALDKFISTFGGDYVTYKGSLTTPPCSEGVVWIISPHPLAISERQLAALRKSVKNEEGVSIQNFRPLQNLNNRDVYYVSC